MKEQTLSFVKALGFPASPACSWGWRLVMALLIALNAVAFKRPVRAELPRARVINGSPSETPWPWMVSLASTGNDLARGHFCGGTLIDPQFVLTSAHCVADLLATPEQVSVVLGRRNLIEDGGTVVPAAAIILFPGFNPDTLQNDLALIRLSTAVSQYQPLPLLSPEQAQQLASGTPALILGWGSTDPNVPIRPAILQQAWIPLVSDVQCLDRLGIDFDPASMLCAGVLSSEPYGSDGIDACYGDSGGPLMVQMPEGWRLLGLTSWGFLCASDRYWGVYVRATAFYDWIQSVLTRALYATGAAAISGTPVVGRKLRCHPATFHGEIGGRVGVQWSDVHSGRILSRRHAYLVKRKDIGRTLSCQVRVSNSLGEALSESAPSGPVFPGLSGRQFHITGSHFVRDAGIYCLRARCSVVLSFRHLVKFAEGAILNESSCFSEKCTLSSAWMEAVRLSETSWRIPLRRGLDNPDRVLVHATQRTPERGHVSILDRS